MPFLLSCEETNDWTAAAELNFVSFRCTWLALLTAQEQKKQRFAAAVSDSCELDPFPVSQAPAMRSLPDRHMQRVCTDYAGAHATGPTGVLDIEGLQVCLAHRLSIAILTYSCFQAPQLRHVTLSAPTITLQQFDTLMFSSATVATCYAFCTNNHFTTVWHTHVFKRHSCDMLRFLHQQSLYNSLTHSCFQAPQLRHVTLSAPTITLQQFDILMFSSATVATCYAFCTNNHFTTVWHSHVFKRHSCDMLRFLHQQSLYNSLTHSCFQAPQLRHVTLSAPTIALQQFDILMLASAKVATW